MSKKKSPTARSLELLRADGYECQIVEKWNAFARVRVDLFGFIDIVAICPYRGIVGVQTTVVASMSARINKIKAEPRSQKWLNAGGRIVVHGWKKNGKRHQQPRSWSCVTVEYPEPAPIFHDSQP
jgi:hypothetical protein